MQTVLFTIPILKDVFRPDGIPLYAFGAMLFITFISVTAWGTLRTRPIGMSPVRFQDFTICIFISGLLGARLLYMIQYYDQFTDRTPFGLIFSFFKIWEGGIIFFGSVIPAIVAYGFFYWFVMRRINVSGWKLADAVAPLLALGLAIGRIGCYLNGCCWGQATCEECAPVPLGSAHFPLLPSLARGPLVFDQSLQTSTGFAIQSRFRPNRHEDPRTEVTVVEPGSPAEAAGLKPGDRVVKVNGKVNSIIVDVLGTEDQIQAAISGMKAAGGRAIQTPSGRTREEFDSLSAYLQGQDAALAAAPGIELYPTDLLDDLAREWPRGKKSLSLGVERDGKEIELPPFTPRTIGLYPTQLYETLSMVLLILVLLAYYPLRHHDGELMVLLMIGYSVHRFVNESLRVEPTVGSELTLSQWASILVFTSAIAIEAYLLTFMPSRWKSVVPTQQSATPASPAASAAQATDTPASVPLAK